MTTIVQVGTPTAELAALASAVEDYRAGAALSQLSDADLVAELRALEVLRRQLAAHDNPLIGELDRRGLGASYGARSTAGLLQDTLRLSPREARGRVDAAQLLGERVTLTGDTLPPLLPATATAHAAGDLSPEHVRAVIATVDDLPALLPVEEFEQVDRVLAEVARHCTPRDVTTAGIRILDTLGVAGHPPSEEDKQRTRRLMLHHRRDGSYDLSGRLSPECGAETDAVLNALATPRPTTDDSGQEVPDERTGTQRLHDALHDLMGLALRADTLPLTGRRAQLIITARCADDDAPANKTVPIDTDIDTDTDTDTDNDADASSREATGWGDTDAENAGRSDPGNSPAPQPHTLDGVAWTSFGQALSARTAMRLCDTAMFAKVTLNRHGGVLAYGQSRRFATKAQLRVLIARDGGCSFPGCHHPPEWCDAHHITSWLAGGPTNIENLTLLCGYHHRHFQRLGWQCQIRQGVPEWTPPPHVDPLRKPRRNLRYLLR